MGKEILSTYQTKDSGKREQHITGAVRDVRTGKGRFDLLNPIPLLRLAQLYERGAIKYGENNWTKGMPISRYVDSAERHLNNYKEGERTEDHPAAVAWNSFGIMFTEVMIERGLLLKELNDMPNYMPRDINSEINKL